MKRAQRKDTRNGYGHRNSLTLGTHGSHKTSMLETITYKHRTCRVKEEKKNI